MCIKLIAFVQFHFIHQSMYENQFCIHFSNVCEIGFFVHFSNLNTFLIFKSNMIEKSTSIVTNVFHRLSQSLCF